MSDPFKIEASLAAKVGSILVHVEEGLSAGGALFRLGGDEGTPSPTGCASLAGVAPEDRSRAKEAQAVTRAALALLALDANQF